MVLRLSLLLRLTFAIAGVAGTVSPSAMAMEGGQSPSLKGYRDFLAGVLPAPGIQFRHDMYLYNGTENSTVPQGQLNVGLKAFVNVLGLTVVTPHRVLGGHYAFAVRGAITDVSVDRTITTPFFAIKRDGTLNALNDIVVSPFVLGWHSGSFHWNFATSVWLPAGNYNKSRIANTGRNYWSVAPQFGITYFDPKSGWEVSAAGIYMVNYRNTETNYQSGNVAQIDFAFGKILTPQFKLGVVGYLSHQLTADSGLGAVLGDRKMRVAGVGPAATFTFLANNTPVILVAKYYREFSAQNTTQGDAGSLSARIKF